MLFLYLLRRQREEYAKFSSAAGLLTQNERNQVYGFGHSQASKAAWAARKAIIPSSQKNAVYYNATPQIIAQNLTNTQNSDNIPLTSLNTKIKTSKQNEHTEGHKRFYEENERLLKAGKNPKSFLYKDINAQDIVNKALYNQNTVTEYSSQSVFPRQYFDCDDYIGEVFDGKSGGYIRTKRVAIIHSSKGTHVYPVI